MENDKMIPCPSEQERGLYMNYGEQYEGDEIDIVDILMIFWTKRFLILAFILLFSLAGFTYVKMMELYYESRTTLLFMPPVPAEMGAEMRKGSSQGNSSPLFPPDVYLSLATADDLLYDTIKSVFNPKNEENVSMPTPEKLREKMKAELNKSSEETGAATEKLTLTVTMKDAVPERALELLTVWGKLFIDKNSALFMDRAGTSYTYIRDSMSSLKGDLDNAENSLLSYQKTNPLQVLEAKLKTLNILYGEIMKQYNNETLKIAPLEARIKATKKLLSAEPKKLSLSKGMSTEAVWNFLAKELSPEELKQLKSMNIDDEVLNEHNTRLKSNLYRDELELATLKAFVADAKKRIDSIRKESEITETKIAEITSQTDCLKIERDTLKKSYLVLADKYQASKIANVEANDTVRIIEKPILPAEPASQGKLKILLLASLLGLFTGITVAFLVHAVQSKKGKTATE